MAAATTLLGVAACSAPAGTPEPGLPGVTVMLHQPRSDVADGVVALKVTNGTGAELGVRAVRLSSPALAGELVWDRGRESVLAPGRRVDLRAPLPGPRCDAMSAGAGGADGADEADAPSEGAAAAAETVTLRAEVDYRTDGRSGTAQVAVSDPFEVLPRLHAEECLRQAVQETVVLTAERLELPVDPSDPATLVISAMPPADGSGGEATVVLRAIRGTVLVSPVRPGPDGAGEPVPELPLDVRLGGDGPGEVEVPVLPARCDAHALADDTVGTLVPVLVEVTDGRQGRVVLPRAEGFAAQVYRYYREHCGLEQP